MSFVGKTHEISFYGLCANIACLICGKVSFDDLWYAALHPNGFLNVFLCYLFWASVLFIPIAVIGAFATKYEDGGMGLTFGSSNIVVIMFAHLGEEILGLVITPLWFLKDLFTKSLTGTKIADYVLYIIELIFIATGLIVLFTY